MDWQYTPYVFPLILVVAFSLGVAFFAYRRRPAPGAVPLTVLMLAVGWWALAYALRLTSADLETKIVWSQIRYLGIVAVPTAWLAFAIQYTGRDRWLTQRNIALLSIEPIAVALLAWSNGTHHLIWSHIELETSGPITVWYASHGMAFWIHTAYSYSIILVGTALLIQTLIRSPRPYRGQTSMLLLGAVTPILGNILSTFHLVSFPLDLTPFAFVIAGILLALGIFRFRLLDIVPVARDAIIEEMVDGVIVLDDRERIIDLNPAASRVINRAPAEAIGQLAAEVLPRLFDLPEQHGDSHESREVALGEGEEQRTFDLRFSSLQDRHGHLTGRLIALRDITKRKRAEEEREQLIQELDAFAHTVAHDLKNPLTTIGGHAQVLEYLYSSLSEEEAKKHLQTIQKGVTKMGNIIDALLLLAGVRTMAEVEIGPLDTADIVGEVERRLAYLIEQSQAKLVLPQTWPAAQGYAPWVEEVWANYISNAIKYGGQPPRVELGAQLEPNGTARFWVRDNGPGIPPEMQSQLFTPFTRLAQARATGHGLGLSIVRHIVERLGGEVGVESEAGQGSTFFFTLPTASDQVHQMG